MQQTVDNMTNGQLIEAIETHGADPTAQAIDFMESMRGKPANGKASDDDMGDCGDILAAMDEKIPY